MAKSSSGNNHSAISLTLMTLISLMLFFITAAKASEIPKGASFELMTDIGFKGSRFYLYSPSHPNLEFDMSRMLNSVVFVYPDKPYVDKDAAWNSLGSTGLLDLAEKEAAYVIMPLPMNGNSWSEEDLKVYYESQYYLAGGDVYTYPSMQFKRLVFNNLQYIIAEGNGATFVNNILSQHAERISGVLTFGGKIDNSQKKGLALPAYLVNADRSTIAYYKAVNKIDKERNNGISENKSYNIKKVIISKGGNTFEADLIADAWKKIFSRTARVCITDNVVLNSKTTSEWVLMDRPNYAELGIDRIDHKNGKLPDGTITTWYDYVPKSVSANPNTGAPLVIVLHGRGDDPIYQADSNGWTAKAAEQGFIVISPDYPGPDDKGEKVVLNILEYAKKTYPIDQSRVYLSGFSMGGAATAMIGLKNADKFAGIAVMGAFGYNDEKVANIVNSVKSKIDLPFVMIIGEKDNLNVAADEKGNMSLTGLSRGGLELLMDINELKKGDPDYAAYPCWGYVTDYPEVLTSKDLKYDASYMHKDNQDKTIAKLVLFENAGHAHSDFYATLAWNFLSRFKR
jgi:poly(3-hydroxybutyrate) depolymerase